MDAFFVAKSIPTWQRKRLSEKNMGREEHPAHVLFGRPKHPHELPAMLRLERRGQETTRAFLFEWRADLGAWDTLR